MSEPCEPHCHADTLQPSSGGMFWCSACDRYTGDEIALAWIAETDPQRFKGACGVCDDVFGPGLGSCCTEPAGHKGDHVASGQDGRVISRWPI